MTATGFLLVLGLAILSGGHALQEQESPEMCECEVLRAQILEMQKNITELSNYMVTLRNAVSTRLRHLWDHLSQSEHMIEDLAHHKGSSSDSYHSHSHQDSGEHDHHAEESSHHDHHAEESTHHDHHAEESTHHDHSGESSHHDEHDHHHNEEPSHSHQDESSHHGDHDHHHEESGHHDEHHHHDDGDGSSAPSHSHEEGDSHHDEHSHDDNNKEKKEAIAEKVVVATTHRHHHHFDHSHDMRSSGARSHSHGHHGHHDHAAPINRTVSFPKSSEHSQYQFASCRMEPNRAIPEDQQQDVRGEVTFWQLKTGGPLGIHVRLQGFKMGGHHAQQVQSEDQDETETTTNHHAMGHKHGFHVHSSGDLSNGCQSTGPHYNPEGVNHGGPFSAERHVGDLGNIECDDHGYTNIMFSDHVASLIGPYSIADHALVIHANADDFGSNPDDPESLRTGNAGTRIACCLIQATDRPSFKAFKYIKRAKSYKADSKQ